MDSHALNEIRERVVAHVGERIQIQFGDFSQAIEERIANLAPEEFGVSLHHEGKFVSEYGLAAYKLLKDSSEYYEIIRACRVLLPRIYGSTLILRSDPIDKVVSELGDRPITTEAIRQILKNWSPERVIAFSETAEDFSDYVRKAYPKYTILFVHYRHIIDKVIIPVFRKITFQALPRAIGVTLDPNLANVEKEEDEREYAENVRRAEQISRRVLEDESFSETQGVLRFVDVEGAITTSPLEISTSSSSDQAKRLVTRALAQLNVDNRRVRITNVSPALLSIVDEILHYLQEDLEQNAILIWQANLQLDAILQASATLSANEQSKNLAGPDRTTDYSIPDLPRDIIIALQQFSAGVGVFILTFEGVQKMLEYYELNNRMRKISESSAQIMFDQLLRRLTQNPTMFSEKIVVLIKDLLDSRSRFEAGKTPKGLVSTVIAVVRGILQSMGRIVLRRTAIASAIVTGVVANAATQGLSDDPLYKAVVVFFQTSRPLLLSLADKFPEYFSYIRSLFDLM